VTLRDTISFVGIACLAAMYPCFVEHAIFRLIRLIILISNSSTKQDDVKRLIDERDAIGLKEISYQMLFNNAFHKMRYPGCPRGIQRATCSEWLHMMQKGQTEYAVEGILGMRKLTSNGDPIESEEDEEATKNNVKGKKRKAQLPKTKKVQAKGEARRRKAVAASETCEDLIYTTKRQVEGHNYVFSKVIRDHVDTNARHYGRLPQRQSNRDLPRTYFAQGLCTATKLFSARATGCSSHVAATAIVNFAQ